MGGYPYKAVILDMDGVLTHTAQLHCQASRMLFDELMQEREGANFIPFTDKEYDQHLSGRTRYEGIRSFLESREISLLEGDANDAADQQTIYGLGEQKNLFFHQLLKKNGVEVFEDARLMLEHWKQQNIPLAVVSSSRNAPYLLAAGGIDIYFKVSLDGQSTEDRGLRGKPQPDAFLAAAEELGMAPQHILVLEDAIAGIEAAKSGNFGWVVGVARKGDDAILLQAGADYIVHSLTELDTYMQEATAREANTLPHALEKKAEIRQKLQGLKPALFLDYDGTLSPIVKDPDKALLSDEMKDVLSRLAQKTTVTVISGRDRADVQQKVGLHEVVYAGSHGFDIQGPNGLEMQYEGGLKAQPALDKANQNLKSALGHIKGIWIERKKYAIAVHYRNVAEEEVPQVIAAVERELDRQEGLKGGGGKMIKELKPALDWHKGRATEWLLKKLNLSSDKVMPIFIGDDLTDEDGLRAVHHSGIGILAGEHGEKTWAHYRVEDVEEVQQFLEELYQML